jgi:hypothetical protein
VIDDEEKCGTSSEEPDDGGAWICRCGMRSDGAGSRFPCKLSMPGNGAHSWIVQAPPGPAPKTPESVGVRLSHWLSQAEGAEIARVWKSADGWSCRLVSSSVSVCAFGGPTPIDTIDHAITMAKSNNAFTRLRNWLI